MAVPVRPDRSTWNPNDPDAVKVHYDLAGWSFEQRAELAAACRGRDPHAWDGDELIVPEQIEDAVDDVVRANSSARSAPFPDAGARRRATCDGVDRVRASTNGRPSRHRASLQQVAARGRDRRTAGTGDAAGRHR